MGFGVVKHVIESRRRNSCQLGEFGLGIELAVDADRCEDESFDIRIDHCFSIGFVLRTETYLR